MYLQTYSFVTTAQWPSIRQQLTPVCRFSLLQSCHNQVFTGMAISSQLDNELSRPDRLEVELLEGVYIGFVSLGLQKHSTGLVHLACSLLCKQRVLPLRTMLASSLFATALVRGLTDWC